MVQPTTHYPRPTYPRDLAILQMIRRPNSIIVLLLIQMILSLPLSMLSSSSIGHFRVPKTLTFKMRLGVQPFLRMSFICMRMKNDFHIKGWAPTLVLKQRLGGTRKWPITCLSASLGDKRVLSSANILLGRHRSSSCLLAVLAMFLANS